MMDLSRIGGGGGNGDGPVSWCRKEVLMSSFRNHFYEAGIHYRKPTLDEVQCLRTLIEMNSVMNDIKHKNVSQLYPVLAFKY